MPESSDERQPNERMPMYVRFMLGGFVATFLFVNFLTPLSTAPVGPNGRPDEITLVVAVIWTLIGHAVGLLAYAVLRIIRWNSHRPTSQTK